MILLDKIGEVWIWRPRKETIYSLWPREHQTGDAVIHPWGVTVNSPTYIMKRYFN